MMMHSVSIFNESFFFLIPQEICHTSAFFEFNYVHDLKRHVRIIFVVHLMMHFDGYFAPSCVYI
jgi:hypothetical protein